MSFMYRSSVASTSSARRAVVGQLHLLNMNGESVAVRQLYAYHEVIIGRDSTKCQWILDDPYLSAKHLRIYTVIYDCEEDNIVEYLVYAEDLSRHGTFWNGSMIGRGNGGFLLSQGDTLRLSSKTSFRFTTSATGLATTSFDLLQETEMTRFREEYVITDRLLGSGTFGHVFMAIEQRARTQVACKMIDLRALKCAKSKHFSASIQPLRAQEVNQKSQINDIDAWSSRQKKDSQLIEQLKVCYREIDILSQLSHPNIISLDKVYVTDNTIYLFQDLITAGDLFSYLDSKHGKLLEVEAAVIIRQVLIALQFLHNQDIVHRDLKPENIMMTSLSTGCRVVLTDFGAARKVKPFQRMTSMVGSDQYAAPEVKNVFRKPLGLKAGYTKAVDMWSVGTITVVLLTGISAFSDPSTGQYSPLLARSCNLQHLQKSKEWQRLRPRPQSFISQLLVLVEQHRMTAAQALEHSWFNNEMHRTDFEELYQRTIKHWYPRTAKNPVVEMMASAFVENLVPYPNPEIMSRRHRREQPIDPPYKPFPRNMHAPLWPRRPLRNNTMSQEVKTAIAKFWTDSPRNPADQSNTNAELRIARVTGSPVSLISCETLALEGLGGKRREPHNLSSPPRQFPNKAIKTSQRVATEPHESGVRLAFSKGTKSQRLHVAPEISNLPVRGLKRSSASRRTASTLGKRWRNSMFDLTDNGDKVNGNEDDSKVSSPANNKKQKEMGTGNTSRMLLPLEAVEKEKAYLPKI